MKPFEINTASTPIAQPPPSSFTARIVQWIGHLWTKYSKQLNSLIERIMRYACPHLSKPKPEEEKKPVDLVYLTPLNLRYISHKTQPKSPLTKSSKPSRVERIPEEESESSFYLEELFKETPVQEKQQPISLALLVPVETSSIDVQKKTADQLNVMKQEKERDIPVFKRRYSQISREDAKEKGQTSLKIASIHSSLAKPVKSIEGFNVFELGAGGNCQLLCILKGIELQYPHLLKYTKEGKLVDYSVQDIRELGVKFARDQIDACGPFAEQVLGYVDSDRQEYNQANVQGVENRLKRELLKLKNAFDTKKIKVEEYAEQVQKTKNEYQQLMEQVKAKLTIHKDKDFLNNLEKKGFFCSTLHLFALSISFRIPIHVHEKDGVTNHDIQIFNSHHSIQEPIHLYRVNNNHYQLLLKLSKTEKPN